MRNYELTLLLKADLAEGQVQGILGEIASMLQDQGALLLSQDTKGKRTLPSPVKSQGMVELAVLKFSLDPLKLAAVEKDLKTRDSIIRFFLLSYLPYTKARRGEKVIAKAGAPAPQRQETQEDKVEIEDIDRRLEEIFRDENL
jgi:ribosomal protein S6